CYTFFLILGGTLEQDLAGPEDLTFIPANYNDLFRSGEVLRHGFMIFDALLAAVFIDEHKAEGDFIQALLNSDNVTARILCQFAYHMNIAFTATARQLVGRTEVYIGTGISGRRNKDTNGRGDDYDDK